MAELWEISSVLSKFAFKVEKELIDFHKTQKTGFYAFEPYLDDFFCNLNLFSSFLLTKYEYEGGSGEAGVSQASICTNRDMAVDWGYIGLDIRISYRPVGDSWGNGRTLNFKIYPDCVVYRSFRSGVEERKLL